jgi:hypothetical protein
MKLYELPRGENTRIYKIRVFSESTKEEREVVLLFDHIDGAYSVCYMEDMEGNLILEGRKRRPAIVHLSASTPLVKYKNGYKIAEK